MGCLIHKWSGCRCEKCGSTRSEGHTWAPSGSCYKFCTTCSDAYVDHQWRITGNQKNCEKCGIAGFSWRPWAECQNAIKVALSEYGEEAFKIPYVYRSFAQKTTASTDVILDAHEYVGVHNLLTALYGWLQLKSKDQLTKDSQERLQYSDYFQFRHDISTYLIAIQQIAGVEGKELTKIDTPEAKKRLGMYL
jgi:hypothetical protein